MPPLPEQILAHMAQLPEGVSVSAKNLLHLGKRAAVNQSLARLSKRGLIFRVDRGIYFQPISTRFGTRLPSIEQIVEALAIQRGETIVPNGAAVANTLGLTTQVPVRSVYLTSGRSRKLYIGAQVLELQHAPRSKLLLPNPLAGV
jgi:predicted transcriptional regulator of viral defense system